MRILTLITLLCLSAFEVSAKQNIKDEVKVISYNIRFANKKDGENVSVVNYTPINEKSLRFL